MNVSPQTRQHLEAFKAWIEAYPHQAAMLFGSPYEYIENVELGEEGEGECRAYVEANDARRKISRNWREDANVR